MKFLIILLVIGGLVYAGYAILTSKSGEDVIEYTTGTEALDTKTKVESELVVLRAKEVFQIAQKTNTDFTDGPCLDNSLIDGWVLDIVHEPREAVDDLPENQCSSYIDGKAQHFVEMDAEGNVIRVQ